MDTVRIDPVVQRVVAWHNRHPLAERIDAAQVHSVGVVELPYALIAPAWVAPDEAPPPPAVADVAAAAPPAAAAETHAVAEVIIDDGSVPAADEAAASGPAPEASPAPAAPTAASPAARPAASPDGAESPPDAGRDPASQPALGPGGAAATEPDAEARPPASAPAAPPSPRRLASRPAAPPGWHPRAWLAALRGAGPLWPVFSEDFIAPLTPRRVARWVARHGGVQRPLDAEAPLRVIAVDEARRGVVPAAAEVAPLYVLTAAIDTGSQRLRLLLSPEPDGPVIGPRQWNRRRVGATGATALSALLTLTWSAAIWMPRGAGDAVRSPLVAGAPASAASAGASASAPDAMAGAASAAPAATVATAAASSASAAMPEATPTVVEETVVSSAGALPAQASAAASSAGVAGSSGDPAVAATSMPAAAAASSTLAAAAGASSPSPGPGSDEPAAGTARRGRVVLAPLVPALDAATRAEARRQSAALRRDAAGAPGPDDKVYALVTAPMVSRAQSERAAAQLQALALLLPGGLRAELMPAGKAWRAVCWPFGSAADAEKVRLALADKGLKTDVLEF